MDTTAVIGIEGLPHATQNGDGRLDVFAKSGSPALLSRACHHGLPCLPLAYERSFLEAPNSVIEHGGYDIIFLCSEPILELLVTSGNSSRWKALPLSEPSALKKL